MRADIIDDFVEALTRFLSRIPAAHTRGAFEIIVNPSAGIYRSKRALRHVIDELRTSATALGSGEQGVACVRSIRVHKTTTDSEGLQTAREITDRAAGSNEDTLIITAGGDGTANILCSHLLGLESSPLQSIAVYRLPMGTGNDGLDAQNTESAWNKLARSHSHSLLPAVRVALATGETRYAFNIASVGLDGWVTHLTNKIKKIIPGSFYSLMVDVAALFYEKRVHIAPMEIILEDGAERFSKNLLLLAMGVSGHRTYGNNKLVLPGDENICAITTVSFFKKFKLKNNFYVGRHVDFPETIMKTARKLTLNYEYPVPMQFDGEVLWLKPEHFPVQLEIVSTGLRILGTD